MVNFEIRILLVFLTALFSAIYVLPKLARIAKAISLVDKPSEKRKVHKFPRPLVGGIGIAISATFSALIFIPIAGLRGYFLGLSILLLTGFFDDFTELGHKEKFLAQIAATFLMMYFSRVSLTSFGNLLGFGEIIVPDFYWIVAGVTIFCIVGVINAINLIDGLDGLAGGVSFVAFIAFAILASMDGLNTLMLLNLALAGAVLGFLKFNWYPSSMFMGDAGSLCLGFSLGFMALALTQGSNAHISPVCPLLILSVPITDTITVMGKRILRGQNPFKADRYHLHHIFMRLGMGRGMTVKVIIGITVLMSLIGLLGFLHKLSDATLFAIFLVYFAIYILSSFFIIHMMRAALKFIKKQEGKRDKALWFYRLLSGKMNFFSILRKSPRYNVQLALTCL